MLGETGKAAPLASFSKVDTVHVDQAEDAVGRIFCSHKLRPLTRGAAGFHAIHNHVGHDGYSANFIAYGTEVTINPGRLDRFYLLQVPLAGGSHVRCGKHTTETDTTHASLLSPTLETQMHWQGGTKQLIILVDRKQVEHFFGALIESAPQTVEFDPGVALETPAGAAILAQAKLMLSLSESGVDRAFSIAHRQIRDMFIGLLLNFQPHGLSHRLHGATLGAAPRHVRRAEEFIAAHAPEDFSVCDLANVAGVGLRTLQEGFRRFRHSTIGDAIQEARLGTWKNLLTDPRRKEGVVQMAYEAGITHPGRWATAYATRFGEYPSETRRKARLGRSWGH